MKKGIVSISMDLNVIENAKAAAARENRNLSNYIESLLRRELTRDCDHSWEIDREDELIKCAKCGAVER